MHVLIYARLSWNMSFTVLGTHVSRVQPTKRLDTIVGFNHGMNVMLSKPSIPGMTWQRLYFYVIDGLLMQQSSPKVCPEGQGSQTGSTHRPLIFEKAATPSEDQS
jgi:hypothetical protein